MPETTATTAMTAIPTRPLFDSTDSLLRLAMRADAALTGFGGLAVAAVAGPLSAVAGLAPRHGYELGAFCVGYGLVVYVLAALPELRRAGVGVAAANAICTLAALVVVVAGVLPLTGPGTAAVAACGVYTSFFALLQYLGVRRLTA